MGREPNKQWEEITIQKNGCRVRRDSNRVKPACVAVLIRKRRLCRNTVKEK